jgi:DNA-binding transcriptional ArsR family regulator
LTTLTAATTTVDAPRAVMMTISQLAERDGVSKQAASKMVRRLADDNGLSVERDAQGRIAALNVAHYDMLRGRYADPSRAQSQAPAAARRPAAALGREIADTESYDEALRQKTWHEAERRRLDLEVQKGKLVPVEDVLRALDIAGETIARALDRLPNIADDIAAAVSREGVHGARTLLRQQVARQRQACADALAAMARPSAQPVASAEAD